MGARVNLRPRTEAAFERARDQLVDAFDAWNNGDERVVVDVANLLLSGRFALGDWRDLTDWPPAVVQDVLLDWVPRAAILDEEYVDAIPRSVAAFVQFLQEECGVTPHAPPAEWHQALDGLLPRMRAEIEAAEAHPSPGRQLILAMQDDGVDLEDEGAVARWIDAYNDRVTALGPSAGVRIPELDDSRGTFDPTGLAPFDLPPRAELERAADGASLMRQVTRFLDWIGDSRPVTKTGNLKVADGYELVEVLGTDDLAPIAGMSRSRVQSAAELNDVDWVYTLARAAGWVSTSATRLYAEPDEDADPLARWERLWLALVSVGPVDHRHAGHRTPVAGHLVDILDGMIVELLLSLHEARTGLPIDALVDDVLAEGMLDRTVEDAVALDMYERWTARDAHHLLDRLAGVGVIEVDGVEWTGDDRWPEPRGGMVRLTPLGAWALSRVVGVAAGQPSMGDVALEDLLDVVDASDELVWASQLDAWTDQHPEAIGEVVDAIRRGDGGGMVELGFALLHSWGERAVPHVRVLVDDPGVGALARVFLTRYGDEQASATVDVDAPEAMVEVLASILDVFGPQALADEVDGLGPVGEQAEMFERLWRVDHPGAERVLETVGKFHRDKKVAKAARKALFKLRTART